MRRAIALLALAFGLVAAPPAFCAPATPAASLPADGKVRLDFREASVLQVIRLLAELSGVNIVATEKASTAKVSVFLQDIGVEAALDAVCKSAGLWYRKDEKTGIWRVMTLDEFQRDIVIYRGEETRVLTLRNSNVVASANAIAALFGGRVRLAAGVEEQAGLGIGGATGAAPGTGVPSGGAAGGTSPAGASGGSTPVRVLTAGQIAGTLDSLAGAAEGGGREGKLADTAIEPQPIFVTYNRLHNLLIMRSSDAAALAEAERLVIEMDRPTRQVLLEMKVLEITLGDSFRSVFDFGLTGGATLGAPAVGHGANPLVPSASQGPQAILGTGNFALEGGTFVFQMMNDRVLARIQLLATENKVKVLSTPMLLASNNQTARLFIGEERVLTTNVTANTVTNANQTITTFSAQTEKRNIGNTLVILPRINADRTVTLSVQQDASSVLAKSATIPVGTNGSIQEFPIDTVNTSNLQVTVIAKDRLAVAVGGMIRERASDAEAKVPLLGDIPLLGEAFKRRVRETVKTELVLVITPHILESPEEGEQRSRERLGALMDQAKALDAGLPRGQQPAVAKSAAAAPPAPNPMVRPDSGDDGRYLTLARAAARMLRDPQATAAVDAGMKSVDAASVPPFHLDRAKRIAARPLAAWQSDGLFVTALGLANTGDRVLNLDTSVFPGHWLAAVLEEDRLSPAGEAASQTTAYLISDRPFRQALPAAALAPGGN